MKEPVCVYTKVGDFTYFKSDLQFNGKLSKRTKTTHLVIHCSASKVTSNISVEDIHRIHQKERGWVGCGYNFFITKDGLIYEGRPMECSGAHATNWNSFTIGICTEGGLDKNGKCVDTRTIEQKESLYKLCYWLMQIYDINLPNIVMHRDITIPKNLKSCPCYSKQVFDSEYLQFVDKKLYCKKE